MYFMWGVFSVDDFEWKWKHLPTINIIQYEFHLGAPTQGTPKVALQLCIYTSLIKIIILGAVQKYDW